MTGLGFGVWLTVGVCGATGDGVGDRAVVSPGDTGAGAEGVDVGGATVGAEGVRGSVATDICVGVAEGTTTTCVGVGHTAVAGGG